MINYVPPLRDMQFYLHDMGLADRIRELSDFKNLSDDLIDAVLMESGKFAAEVLSPINHTGDIEGSKLQNGSVSTPRGFVEAYDEQFVKGGWASLPFSSDYGGQNLPWLFQQQHKKCGLPLILLGLYAKY